MEMVTQLSQEQVGTGKALLFLFSPLEISASVVPTFIFQLV
jgi:hypothetical protein